MLAGRVQGTLLLGLLRHRLTARDRLSVVGALGHFGAPQLWQLEDWSVYKFLQYGQDHFFSTDNLAGRTIFPV